MQLQLISFKICPFVQRSVIILLEKDISFDIEYIDINNPPDWFIEISPFGKVPVLKTNGTVLFESAIINEYLDEITPPSLHPRDPLTKALHRGWIEYASSLLFAQHDLYWSSDAQQFQQHLQQLIQRLQRVEQALDCGPYFSGEQLCLVDVAYAPLLMRFSIMENRFPAGIFHTLPKLQAWTHSLCALPSVSKSTVAEFETLYLNAISKAQGYLNSVLGN